jgi:hypothetical protein
MRAMICSAAAVLGLFGCGGQYPTAIDEVTSSSTATAPITTCEGQWTLVCLDPVDAATKLGGAGMMADDKTCTIYATRAACASLTLNPTSYPPGKQPTPTGTIDSLLAACAFQHEIVHLHDGALQCQMKMCQTEVNAFGVGLGCLQSVFASKHCAGSSTDDCKKLADNIALQQAGGTFNACICGGASDCLEKCLDAPGANASNCVNLDTHYGSNNQCYTSCGDSCKRPQCGNSLVDCAGVCGGSAKRDCMGTCGGTATIDGPTGTCTKTGLRG